MPRIRCCLLLTTVLVLGLPEGPSVLSQARAEDFTSALDWFRPAGRQFRRAFREVVSTPRTCAVELKAGEELRALGTVVSEDGWIVTKASQLNDATTAQLSDGRRFDFHLVGCHLEHDLALLKIDAQSLPVIDWDTTAPPVGAWLASVGTRRDPVAVGVLSVPRRRIPRSDIHGFLGIELEQEEMPRIRRVLPNTGASAAGLQEGDIVLQINSRDISSPDQLIKALREFRPGDSLQMRIRRADAEISPRVTLTYPFADRLSRIAIQNQMGGELSFRRDDFESVYQHDAVLRPEDCGGPVVTLDGRAVGINIARAGRTESYVLPADVILRVLPEMQEGKFPPPLKESDGAAETVEFPAATP